MRLLLDEMIGPRVAAELRTHALDVVSVVERMDLRALSDEAVLEFACTEQRILVTRNVGDFARLHHHWLAQGRLHAGLVLVAEQSFPQNRNLIGALVRALALAAADGELPPAGELRFLAASSPDRG